MYLLSKSLHQVKEITKSSIQSIFGSLAFNFDCVNCYLDRSRSIQNKIHGINQSSFLVHNKPLQLAIYNLYNLKPVMQPSI